ncbi:hypothetical protein H4S01_005761, partial [Coemansia sp. RSA 2610]
GAACRTGDRNPAGPAYPRWAGGPVPVVQAAGPAAAARRYHRYQRRRRAAGHCAGHAGPHFDARVRACRPPRHLRDQHGAAQCAYRVPGQAQCRAPEAQRYAAAVPRAPRKPAQIPVQRIL